MKSPTQDHWFKRTPDRRIWNTHHRKSRIDIYFIYEMKHIKSLRKRGLIKTGNFDTITKGKRTKVRTASPRDTLTAAPKTGMTS